MKILTTTLYEQQLKEILRSLAKENFQATKAFKMYLDTIIINMPTKAQKYKTSIYFDNENIRDIEHEDYTIIFYSDNDHDSYLILAIIKKNTH